MTNELFQIKNLLIGCAELGAARCLKKMQPKSDEITQRAAYSEFGEAWVKGSLGCGLVARKRHGKAKNSAVYYSRAELLALKNAEEASRLGTFANTVL